MPGLSGMIITRLAPNYGACEVLEAVLSVAIRAYTTQPSLTASTVCVCWMWGKVDVLMEEWRSWSRGEGDRWRSKQKKPRWGLVGAIICLCSCLSAWMVRCALCLMCIWGLFFCNSCAFLWEAEMRREGLAVQCLFSIRLLSLGRQLLSQLLPESPWQHLPLWAGRKTMPNIRKKQNHCLHMSRDCPPLVCLLRPMIANLCKTIPVAKEEGALERNILSGHSIKGKPC